MKMAVSERKSLVPLLALVNELEFMSPGLVVNTISFRALLLFYKKIICPQSSILNCKMTFPFEWER
jgi:hypothetical protein